MPVSGQTQQERTLLLELRSLQQRLQNLRRQKKAGRSRGRVMVVSYDLPVEGQYGEHEESEILLRTLQKAEDTEFCWVGLGKETAGQPHLAAIAPSILDQDVFKGHYYDFCKAILWPLLHAIPPAGIYTGPKDGSLDTAWENYMKVNNLFAQRVIQEYREGDVIMIQNYHLFLVPYLVRDRLPDATIGFFLHTPFPSSEFFRILPYRNRILQGMLASDAIGFQTFLYARHFLSACSRIMGYEGSPEGVQSATGHYTRIVVAPVGLDLDYISSQLSEKSVVQRRNALEEEYKHKTMLVAIDSMDHIKGIMHKLSAFEVFLKRWPSLRQRVALVQVCLPIRSEREEFMALRSQVNEKISSINSRFGTVDFLPIHYISQNLSPQHVISILSAADAAIITPLKDGMNLLPFKFIACQLEKKGQLIVSEFAGSAYALSGVLTVNPWATDEVAESIHRVVVMPADEQAINHEHVYRFVKTYDSNNWISTFLRPLREKLMQRQKKPRAPIVCLDTLSLRSAYLQSKKRLIVLDYDGTLVQIQSRPELARMHTKLMNDLKTVCDDPKNTVLIVSGRTKSNMEQWLGFLNCCLAAENGAFLKYPQEKAWITTLAKVKIDWKEDVIEIMNHYTERTPGSFLERKDSALTWHFYDADPEFGPWQAKQLQDHLTSVMSTTHTALTNESKTVEVRPALASKFHVLKRFCRSSVLHRPLSQKEEASGQFYDFVFCAGDDKSDEFMFQFFAERNSPTYQFTCTVNEKDHSFARYFVDNPSQIADVFELLTQLVSK